MIQTEAINGPFRISKAQPARPRREHGSFEAAEAEARRLLRSNPSGTFIIARDVARVEGASSSGQRVE